MNESGPGMSLIVKTVTRWIKGFILLYAIYIILFGHVTPGGGFPGGVILACGFILIVLAEGQRVAFGTLKRTVAAELDSVGALLFLAIAITGMFTAGVFFINWLPVGEAGTLCSGGTILGCNIGIGLKVGMSLFVIFVMLAALRVAPDSDGGQRLVRNRGDGT